MIYSPLGNNFLVVVFFGWLVSWLLVVCFFGVCFVLVFFHIIHSNLLTNYLN